MRRFPVPPYERSSLWLLVALSLGLGLGLGLVGPGPSLVGLGLLVPSLVRLGLVVGPGLVVPSLVGLELGLGLDVGPGLGFERVWLAISCITSPLWSSR